MTLLVKNLELGQSAVMGRDQGRPNRLAQEKSPYLLQHAYNPVDWYPWGEEAFLAAKELDKPIFLSIGYATCHWCHVMEKESFMDEEIAKVMNDAFINVKLDREEHPEVDSLYMEMAQGMMSGSAGWPLNMILTSNLEPIFAATYLPPMNRFGMMGLLDLAEHFKQAWRGEEKEKLVEQAERIVETFKEHQKHEVGKVPLKEEVQHTAEIFFKICDPVYGGLKGSPKFPLAYQLNFLLRYAKQKQDGRALFLVEKTLTQMRRGGIFDHIGGGFSRYSVDERWMIPHFEKMLYDNAIIVDAYLEGYLATKEPLFKETVQASLNYLLREMQSDLGGFYSAEDADSDGHEGLFYTWTTDEFRACFSEEDVDLFCLYFDVTPGGNFDGRCVINTPDSLHEFCRKFSCDEEEFQQKVDEAKKLLFQEREKRSKPMKDDKIITHWNGLVVHTLAEAGMCLNEERYVESAKKSCDFLLRTLWDGQVLKHSFREGIAQFNGSLDDYAALIKALLTLFEITSLPVYLTWALEFAAILQQQFEKEEGGFYQTDGLDEHLLVRKAPFADGAEPSGNALHGENLLRLYQLTKDPAYLRSFEGIMKGVSHYLGTYSPGFTYHVMNLLRYYDKKAPTFIISVGQDEALPHILEAIYSHYLPHKAVIIHRGEESLTTLLPYLREYPPLENKTTMYLCVQNHCKEPSNKLNKILEMIEAL